MDSARWAGADRYDTAVAVAQERGFGSLADADMVILVEGQRDSVWPAGFVGAVHAATRNGPLLLTAGGTLPDATVRYLQRAAPASAEVLCMPGVAGSACEEARAILQTPPLDR